LFLNRFCSFSRNGESVADGLFGGIEKESMTFGLFKNVLTVSCWLRRRQTRKAAFLLWNMERQTVEGAGSVSIAAVIENEGFIRGKRSCCCNEQGKHRG